MSEKQNKNVTVRVQKIKKNHIKQKLVFFLILAIGLVILAVFSEHLCPYDPYAQDLASALQPPSLQHPMGTDTYGRDMLSRVISGARASIFSTFILVAVIFVLGTAVGVCCGYFGGAADTVMMRISDICLAFPGLVFAMAIAAILGRHSECCYSTGSSKLAEIFTYCQRADSGIKRGTLYSCCHTGR